MDVLRSFVAISEYGGFTQAGDALGRSQAAISLQIKKLEILIDKPLFDRSGHRFSLTPAGETLMDYAGQILALNDRALLDLSDLSVEGRVRLGIPSEFATTLLPRIVGRFASENPSVRLEVNCDLSKNLLVAINKGEYDLILGLHRTPSDAGKNLIKTDRLVWVSNPDYESEADIALIAAPEGCIYRSRAAEELNKQSSSWRVVYTIPDLSGICSALEEGLGMTVLAESTVPKNLRVIEKNQYLPKLGQIGISLITAVTNPGRACLALRSHIENALGERAQVLDYLD